MHNRSALLLLLHITAYVCQNKYVCIVKSMPQLQNIFSLEKYNETHQTFITCLIFAGLNIGCCCVVIGRVQVCQGRALKISNCYVLVYKKKNKIKALGAWNNYHLAESVSCSSGVGRAKNYLLWRTSKRWLIQSQVGKLISRLLAVKCRNKKIIQWRSGD